ncbi:hypothetical protein [Pleionea sediminis]|uniref:DUF7832 domain-containing protein n=1 Tax=Pleionea sediminis TaxID=2569479 RepID=UPI00118498CC|nr:hypothetical protein [Pleionea sediminis]
MKYDDASWHYGGDFPENLPTEAGATHIGMFVTWCLLNDLGGELHTDELPESLAILRERKNTPGQWFIENCDEKFTDEDLNEIGNAFTHFFYASDEAPYYSVYENCLGENIEHLYEVPDTWESYDKLAPFLSENFQSWIKNQG